MTVACAKRSTFIACLFASLSTARAEPVDERAQIVVGTMRAPPFVLRSEDGEWSGVSIELWKQIATELNAGFELREYDYDDAGLMHAVERGQIDVALAAIPLTAEGEQRFDFSHAYFTAGLGIAVRAEPARGLLTMLQVPSLLRLLATIGALAGVLLLVGTIMWLLERRQNPPHFDPHPARGIVDGLWWAAVTMTTTGYGDKVPVSVPGRALGLLWMFTSIFIIAVFSATMASSFVVDRLKTRVTGPGDLPQAKVGVVAGSTGARWAKAQNLQVRTYPYAIQASKALKRGDIEALIHERAILGHMIAHYSWRELQVLPHTLAVHDYAIALPVGSPLREMINRALLTILRRPEWAKTVEGYVGSSARSATAE